MPFTGVRGSEAFCELRLYGVLRSSHKQGSANFAMKLSEKGSECAPSVHLAREAFGDFLRVGVGVRPAKSLRGIQGNQRDAVCRAARWLKSSLTEFYSNGQKH